MSIEIFKAERHKAKLRLGLAGPSGAGKTMSSLKLAKGMSPAGKIVLIDTERGSGDLYADLFDYSIIRLDPPFKPEKYVEAIHAAEEAGFDVIIIDSLSHAWSDEGGLLDQADKLSAGGNRFTAWAQLTPQHRKLVNGMLNSTSHIVATVRSKQEYAMEKDEKTGRSSVKKLGMAPVQRDGMEYEFTVFMDIDQNHVARASKDRTNMFKDELFTIDESIGERVMKWLNSGKEDPKQLKAEVSKHLKRLGVTYTVENAKEIVPSVVKEITGLEWEPKNLVKIVKKLSTTKEYKQKSTPAETPKNEAGEGESEEKVNEPKKVAKASPAKEEVAKKGVEDTNEINPSDIEI